MSSFDLEKAKKDGLVNTYNINFENMPITDDDILYLCQNIVTKQIVNVNLIGTQITDKALEYLATFPKLKLLFVNKTAITGQGFCHFAGHKKLAVIWVENTSLDDEILPLIAQIPNMTAFLIEGTKITWQGLLTLAKHPHIRPVARGGQFLGKQLKEFRQTQREFAKKNKTAVNADDLAKVTAQLLAFFEAVHSWEALAEPDFNDEMIQKSTEIYRQFFTKSWHNTQRMHLQSGGSYQEHKIVDSEYVSKNRIYLYTEDGQDTPHRFLCIRQADDLWLFDKMQTKFDYKWVSYTP
ncbi:NTF2 fold immunity protein [Moraxella oblonga]|uniref:NTF2 fold immunity protein n=1 Tax=Moraxella oblonga TaxID=200413 RepID=UPI00082F163C|nr:NTF2 fold immunity protein [Moraxella oblonga]